MNISFPDSRVNVGYDIGMFFLFIGSVIIGMYISTYCVQNDRLIMLEIALQVNIKRRRLLFEPV